MSRPGVSRRGVLVAARSLGAAAAAAPLVAACRFDPAPPAPPTPPPDPDAPIVTAARAELSELIARLSAGSGQGSLVSCHRLQLHALGGTAPPSTRRVRPLTGKAAAARESRAVLRFTRWAQRCVDGDLARILASIAAGIAMQPVLREAS